MGKTFMLCPSFPNENVGHDVEMFRHRWRITRCSYTYNITGLSFIYLRHSRVKQIPILIIRINLQDLVAVIGAAIGALRIPEKWIPGRLDLVLNSHNVMHVMVVLAVCSMHTATLKDLAWMSDPSSCNKTSYPPSDREEL